VWPFSREDPPLPYIGVRGESPKKEALLTQFKTNFNSNLSSDSMQYAAQQAREVGTIDRPNSTHRWKPRAKRPYTAPEAGSPTKWDWKTSTRDTNDDFNRCSVNGYAQAESQELSWDGRKQMMAFSQYTTSDPRSEENLPTINDGPDTGKHVDLRDAQTVPALVRQYRWSQQRVELRHSAQSPKSWPGSQFQGSTTLQPRPPPSTFEQILVASPGDLVFGEIRKGQYYRLTVTLKNPSTTRNATCRWRIPPIRPTIQRRPPLAESTDCTVKASPVGGRLAAGMSCQVEIRFHAQDSGTVDTVVPILTEHGLVQLHLSALVIARGGEAEEEREVREAARRRAEATAGVMAARTARVNATKREANKNGLKDGRAPGRGFFGGATQAAMRGSGAFDLEAQTATQRYAAMRKRGVDARDVRSKMVEDKVPPNQIAWFMGETLDLPDPKATLPRVPSQELPSRAQSPTTQGRNSPDAGFDL
jgi:hypothetical protein